MNESLELRNRINKMRSINNLEKNHEKLLNHENNKLVNTEHKYKKVYIDDSQKRDVNNEETTKNSKTNNPLDNF